MDISAVAYRLIGPRAVLSGSPVGDSLDNVNTSPLPDGAICWVVSELDLFVFRKRSSSLADGINIVAPAAGGPGRWFRYVSGDSELVFYNSLGPFSEFNPPGTFDFITVPPSGIFQPNSMSAVTMEAVAVNVAAPTNAWTNRVRALVRRDVAGATTVLTIEGQGAPFAAPVNVGLVVTFGLAVGLDQSLIVQVTPAGIATIRIRGTVSLRVLAPAS
jgi:hypothetical protein